MTKANEDESNPEYSESIVPACDRSSLMQKRLGSLNRTLLKPRSSSQSLGGGGSGGYDTDGMLANFGDCGTVPYQTDNGYKRFRVFGLSLLAAASRLVPALGIAYGAGDRGCDGSRGGSPSRSPSPSRGLKSKPRPAAATARATRGTA
jgi:hypothetical protein